MAQLVEFTSVNGGSVFVNPAQVIKVETVFKRQGTPDPDVSRITTTEINPPNFLHVEGRSDDVARLLSGGI